jgi:transcriptional regulatory protein GAL4
MSSTHHPSKQNPSNLQTSYFLFQAGLIPVVLLMTDPSNPEAASWVQDIETTKALLTHPSLGTNRFATRCYEVINRLLGPSALSAPGIPPEQEDQKPPFQMMPQQQQQNFMPFPGQLFSDPGFGGSLFPVEQQMQMHSPAGMDFSEWVNFPPAE